jgi:hypothetical protein
MPAGPIQLNFAGASDSSLTFDLGNGSSDHIEFRGWRGFMSDTRLSTRYVGMICGKGESLVLVGATVDHGDDPDVVRLSARTRMRVTVHNAFFDDFKGDKCKIRLQLVGGVAVQSDEFSP